MTVDLDSLLGRHGPLGGEVGGAGPLDPEACRRLACDGALTRVLVTRQQPAHHHPDHGPSVDHGDTDGHEGLGDRLRAAVALLPPVLGGAPTQPLEVGRASRVVQAAQRTALAVRDGGCVFPGCARPLAWCEAHHLRHWLHGGPTDLANLALVCRAHHRAVHEGGWRLVRQRDGRLTASPPHRPTAPQDIPPPPDRRQNGNRPLAANLSTVPDPPCRHCMGPNLPPAADWQRPQCRVRERGPDPSPQPTPTPPGPWTMTRTPRTAPALNNSLAAAAWARLAGGMSMGSSVSGRAPGVPSSGSTSWPEGGWRLSWSSRPGSGLTTWCSRSGPGPECSPRRWRGGPGGSLRSSTTRGWPNGRGGGWPGSRNVRVVTGDALAVPPPRRPFRVVANLPFGLTTAILRRLLGDPRTALERADLVGPGAGGQAVRGPPARNSRDDRLGGLV